MNLFKNIKTHCSARILQWNKPRATTTEIQTSIENIAKRTGYKQQGDATIRKKIPVNSGHVHASFAAFLIKREPAFLHNSGIEEQRAAYILLFERGNDICLLSSNIGDAIKIFNKGRVSEVDQRTCLRLLTSAQTKYDKAALRTMNSNIRGRTVEGDDLENTMSSFTAHRSVPRALRFSEAAASYSVSPSVARIRQHQARLEINSLAKWAEKVLSDINPAKTRLTTFVERFANATKLSAKPKNVVPNGILADVRLLLELEAKGIVTLESAQNSGQQTTSAELRKRIESWAPFLRISSVTTTPSRGTPVTTNTITTTAGDIGTLRQNIETYSLICSSLNDIKLVDESLDKTTVGTWLTENKQFCVTFSDPSYCYLEGGLYQDQGVLTDATVVCNILETDWDLSTATSEKPDTSLTPPAAQNTTLFGITETILGDEEALICDDLGDEWADYISVANTTPPTIRLIHCKHGPKALGASQFHIVVAQALKNLGRLSASSKDLDRKFKSWGTTKRIIGLASGDADRARRSFTDANSDPQTRREVVLVVSFLSKAAFEAELEKVAKGDASSPENVQLLWLISSFMNSCMEVGAIPRIKCQL